MPSRAVILSVRITYFPPELAIAAAALSTTSALKVAGSFIYRSATTTYVGGLAWACSPWMAVAPIAMPATSVSPVTVCLFVVSLVFEKNEDAR